MTARTGGRACEAEGGTTRRRRLEARLRARLAPIRARVEPRLRAWMAPLRADLEPRLRAEVATRTRAILVPRAAWLAEARADADAVRTALLAAERHAAAALARLDRSPFSGDTTVHAAHARHPGVQLVFARHGLPRCLDCAVGADETLAEAASGEGLPLDELLKELHALPRVYR